jgi:hypothetical protein
MALNIGEVMRRDRVIVTVLSLICAISLAINVLQGRRIYTLQLELGRMADQGTLPVGVEVPSLEGTDRNGQYSAIRYTPGGLPVLLYVFRPSCGWCARNGEAISVLSDHLRGRYRVVGVSLSTEGLAEFITEHKMAFEVITNILPSSLAAYHLGMTPQIIVVRDGGKVGQRWTGALSGPTKKWVERFFGVTLPNIAEGE